MKKGDTRHYRLQWLAGLTAAALLGIVALQAYWLNTSYAEQQARFRADVENAIVTTLIKSQLSSAIAQKGNGSGSPIITEGLTDIISSVVGKIPAEATKGQPRVVSSVTIDMADSSSPQARALRKLVEGQLKNGAGMSNIVLELNTEARQQPGRIYLDSMKALLKTELQKRSIYTPSELALLDSNGHIYVSTCD